eukprot:scaffold83069_cov60-Phaeocystis_antarctica.AAC.3
MCIACVWCVHTDPNPNQDAVVKLGDFGLAKDDTNSGPSNATTQCGTPDYMAPEVLEGRPYEAAADIFSLGAVLYALITSRFPKMLALHVSQGKPLEWPDQSPSSKGADQSQARQLAATNPNPDPDPNPNPNPDPDPNPNQARQLAASMLQLDAAKRGNLDLLAARAAALPGAELLP